MPGAGARSRHVTCGGRGGGAVPNSGGLEPVHTWSWANLQLIRIRDLTWNIGTKNHGPALQVRGAPSTLNGGFLGATDLGTRSVLESVSVSKSLF